jgi:hypothetical protein
MSCEDAAINLRQERPRGYMGELQYVTITLSLGDAETTGANVRGLCAVLGSPDLRAKEGWIASVGVFD